jgi:hypothetical protein
LDAFLPELAMTPRLRALAAVSERLPDFLTAQAGPLLHQLALEAPSGTDVVDLGSGRGKHALWLAAGVADRGHGRFIAVDLWPAPPLPFMGPGQSAVAMGDPLLDGFRAVLREGAADAALHIVRAAPLDAGLRWAHGINIGLLHFPAQTELPAARRLFEAWVRFVVPGGMIVFDQVPGAAGSSGIAMELARWMPWHGNGQGKWVVRKAATTHGRSA